MNTADVLDQKLPLVERLRYAAERGYRIPAHTASLLMEEAADVLAAVPDFPELRVDSEGVLWP